MPEESDQGKTDSDIDLTNPKSSTGDYLHSVVTTGIPAIATLAGTLGADPTIGTAAGIGTAVFSVVVGRPLESRLNQWREKVGKDIQMLKAKGINIESLSDDPRFLTIVVQATLIAIRNHHDEKILALRNSILNTALSIDIDENEQLMFLNLIDAFTPLHLMILRFYSNREGAKPISLQPSGIMDVIDHELEEKYPELKGKWDIYYAIVKELYNNGLIDTKQVRGIHPDIEDRRIRNSYLTPRGERFLKFISPPSDMAT